MAINHNDYRNLTYLQIEAKFNKENIIDIKNFLLTDDIVHYLQTEKWIFNPAVYRMQIRKKSVKDSETFSFFKKAIDYKIAAEPIITSSDPKSESITQRIHLLQIKCDSTKNEAVKTICQEEITFLRTLLN